MYQSSEPETQDNKFKRRLVGGLVLIALAVIIIPLLLDFRKDYDRVIKGTNIPPKPDDFRVEVMPLTLPEQVSTLPPSPSTTEATTESDEEVDNDPPEAPSSDAPEQTAAPEIPADPPVQTPAPVMPVVTPPKAAVTEPPPKPATPPEVKKPANVAKSVEATGWVVQLGSFSSKQNAEELRDLMQRKGYRPFIDSVKVDGQLSHRVRIGPMEKKSGAEAIRDRLAADMKLDTRVLSYP